MKTLLPALMLLISTSIFAQTPAEISSKVDSLESRFTSYQLQIAKSTQLMHSGHVMLLSGVVSGVVGGSLLFAASKVNQRDREAVQTIGYFFAGVSFTLNIGGLTYMVLGSRKRIIAPL